MFRAVKGHYWRQLRHKIKALMTMLICYRRKYAKAWFDEVVESFRNCSTMAPDYGRSVKWPKPPPAMIVSVFVTLTLSTCNWFALSHVLNIPVGSAAVETNASYMVG